MKRKGPPDECFAARFRTLCDRNHVPWTQAAIAKFIGKSGAMAWNYMTGTKLPAMETAIDLARRFGCPVEWLLTGRGPAHVEPDAAPQPPDIQQAIDMLQVMESGVRYKAIQMIGIMADDPPPGEEGRDP